MKPYLCPVCEGKRTVVKGFYSPQSPSHVDAFGLENCRTCNGTGILWSWDCSPIPDHPPWETPLYNIPPNFNDGTIDYTIINMGQET